MKSFRSSVFLIGLALAAASALATGNHTPPPTTPTPTPSTSTSKADASANAAALAAAQANNSVKLKVSNHLSATGGNAASKATGGSAVSDQSQAQHQTVDAGANNGVSLSDQSRSSYNAVGWAPVIHGEGASPLPSAGLLAVKQKCGPKVRVVTTQIMNTHRGVWGGVEERGGAYTQELGPYLDENGNPELFIQHRNGIVEGDEVIVLAAALATSTAGSFSLGGFSKGDGLQGGAAASGAGQQIGSKTIVRPCVFATVVKAVEPPPPNKNLPPRPDRN